MKRRHLFDRGFPVATQTLLAGSEVLLALTRQALRRSDTRLAVSCLLLANTVAHVRVAQRRVSVNSLAAGLHGRIAALPKLGQ